MAPSVRSASAVPARARPVGEGGETPSRVLIVDDTATNRRLLGAMLSREGYELHDAPDGPSALARAREVRPDLVLLDIMMPDMDGYAVCAELKADPRTADIPVIFLSARSQSEDKIRGLGLGAVDYVTKPFSRGEILARVRTHLEMRRLSERLTRMNSQLLAKQRRLDEDLKAAAIIQRSLIPAEERKTSIPGVAIDWAFRPSNRIGGDVFQAVRLDAEHVGLWIVDVSGHGVPAAMVTVSVSQTLGSPQGGALKETTDAPPWYRLPGPSEVCRRLDRDFPVERFGKFFTFAYLLLDVRDGRMRYARAAHPRPVVVRRGGGADVLDSGGTIIGLDDGHDFPEAETRLEPGDRVYLYTDGIVEAAAPDGGRFGEARLVRLLEEARGDLADVCDEVLGRLARFARGRRIDDDVTFVAIEYLGPPPA